LTPTIKAVFVALALCASAAFAVTNYPGDLDTIPVFGTAIHGQPVAKETINNLRDALLALENKVGKNGSAVTSTLDYLLTNTASIDPGHKHTGASITSIDASSITIGTLSDARLSANIAKLNTANTWALLQTFSSGISVTGTVTATTFSGSGVSLTNIPETAITDGSLLARVAANESISGTWSFTGNIAKIRNVTYVWPAGNGSGILTNDGSGNLSWDSVATLVALVTSSISTQPGNAMSIFTTGTGDNDITLTPTEHGHVAIGIDGSVENLNGTMNVNLAPQTVNTTNVKTPVNFFSPGIIPAAGRVFHISTGGNVRVGTGGADTFHYTIEFAGTSICDGTVLDPVPTTAFTYRAEVDITIVTAGSSGALQCNGYLTFADDVGVHNDTVLFDSGAAFIDLDGTPALTFVDFIEFSVSDPTNSITEDQWMVEGKN
jgi:hypothetical protein